MLPRRSFHGLAAACGLSAALAAHSWPAAAADPGAPLVATFARHVQPLILNKCATGACHGGPSAHAPRFRRGLVSGQLDRVDTLANIDALTSQVETPEDLESFIATISRRHPDTVASARVRLAPVTPRERAVLERWLVAALGTASPSHTAASHAPTNAAVVGASAVPPAAAAPAAAASRHPLAANRFSLMLEAAANPPPLPPPEEPQGIILGRDREE